MSGEMIAIIAAAIALASVMVPGMRGVRRDMQQLEVRLTKRMSEHETRLTERMSALETKLTERMTRLETTLTERVARLEGLFEGSMHSRKPRKTRH
ncbi:MAG: hypothetical protein OXJ54_14010 [Gemmatimonadetes bacterium]|nr:hypothetical protein [Candidatus Palauibacter rhopaloidicola]